jgi:hypothetical protein
MHLVLLRGLELLAVGFKSLADGWVGERFESNKPLSFLERGT